MSTVKVQGNASGTGVFTVTSPNSNNTQTLTLPDATGTLVNTTDANLSTLTAASASDITGVNTTATVTSGTTSMTVGSGTGIVAGMYVVAQGITPGTTVSTVVGTAVTLSANAGATLSAAPVTFYAVNKVVTPGSIGGQTCRAWVNFTGLTTATIQASFNVSSVTYNGTGDYTVNFTNALTDANYSITGVVKPSSAYTDTGVALFGFVVSQNAPSLSASQFRIVGKYGLTASLFDMSNVCVAVFR